VPLPQNSYSQERAVLDGVGNNSSPVTNSDLNSALKNISRTAYPSTGASSGAYLPYTVNPSTGVATMSGGGIYVEGNAGRANKYVRRDGAGLHHQARKHDHRNHDRQYSEYHDDNLRWNHVEHRGRSTTT
jgi:hypothetical protein